MPAAHHTLTIRFSPLDGQTYRVQLAGPTIGDCAGTFTPPYDVGTWSAILEALAPNFDLATASPETQAAIKPLGDLATLPRTAGTALTQALLASPEIAAGLEIALSIAAADRQPLAVDMRFAQGCDAIAALPWELLYYRDHFLLADISIALSRNDQQSSTNDREGADSELTPAVRATFDAIIDERRAAGVTINSPEDLRAALVAHPDLQARLKATLHAAMETFDLTGGFDAVDQNDQNQPQLRYTLEQFVQARSGDESQRVVEQHPELLSDDTDAMLSAIIDDWQARQNQDAVTFLTAHRALLRRCREVGIPRAYAEQMLTPDALAEAQRLGLAPEEFLAQMRAAQEMPPALRDVLAELAASGIEIRTQADLETALAARPDLQARLEAAMPTTGDDTARRWSGMPAELQSILQELSRPARRTEMARRAQLCRQALALLERDENPPLWAALQVQLGNSLAQSLSGDRADNIEQAIAAYQQALEVMTRQAMPVEWAQVMMNLATTYWSRIRGDRADNMEQAIAAYRQTLDVMTRQARPVEWAACMMNLATAYANRIRGDRADNLEQAIAAYLPALEVMTRQATPLEWATGMMKLAIAYAGRIRGDRADNMEQAIAAYRQALEVRTRQAMPVEWAECKMNLASAYWSRIRGDRADNMEQAIAGYRQALEVMTRQAMPVEWAMGIMNLATAYAGRIRGDRADNLEQAIAAYQQALEVITRQAMPVEWATTMMNLAIAYQFRVRGDRADNLEQAIAAYRQALEVMTRQAMPLEWAQATMNLATAYADRIRGDRAENIEQAIAAYQQALEVMTRQATPLGWAHVMMNLATAYQSRIRGDRADNLEQTIAAYRQALEVRTRQAMPVEWAQVTMGLATAYADRIRGDRADNLEQAIAAYHQALEVRTRQAMPLEWAQVTMGLANAYANRIQGDRANNLEQAIAAYQEALEIRTRQAMPLEWAECKMNLASAYWSRIRGDRAENIEQAIAAFQEALEIRTRQAMPVEWAQATMGLANAYWSRVRGDRAENIEQAIAAYQEALEVRTRQAMPVEWAECKMNLASAYWSRIRGDRAENIEQAIAAYQEALEVMTRQAIPVRWAQATMNLANAYADRVRGDRAENIEQAIQAYHLALEVMTRQAMPIEWATSMMNLASAYSDRIQGVRAENIEDAIVAYQKALDIFKPETTPYHCRLTARGLGNVLFGEQRFVQAVTPYRLAIQATGILLQQSLLRGSKEVELGEMQGLPANAAYALARSGQPKDLEEAVEVLEAGRARLLAEALEQNRHDLEQLESLGHKAVLERYRAASDHVMALQQQAGQSAASSVHESADRFDYSAWREQLEPAHRELDAAIATIRLVPGYEDFFLPPSFEKIGQAATPNVPLVYLATTPVGGLALIVTSTGVEPPLRLDFSESDLDALLFDQDGAGRYLRGAFDSDWDALGRSLAAALPLLGERVMAPLASKLAELGSHAVTLIPTGRLGLLPLHAAPIAAAATTVTFADRFATAYAPSALALLHNRARCLPAARAFLAVGDPQPQEGKQVDQALVHLEPLLRQASAQIGDGSILSGTAATVERLRQELQQPPAHLLLGCHGVFNVETPLDSGLELFDGRFTVGQLIAATRLQGAALVMLCACQSSLSDFRRTPDEFTGLPGGFIQAGAQAVIGALWLVDAFPTALLFQHFYELLAAGVVPAVALPQAAAWLRDLSAADYRRARGCLLQTASARAAFYIELSAPRDVEDRPFADPIYWAAFTFSGELAPAA